MSLNEDQNQLIRALNVVSSGIPVRAAVFSREEDIKKGTKEPEKEAPVIESELGTQPTSGAWDMRQLGYSSPAAINTPVFQMCTHSLWASLAAANLEVYNCQNLKRYNHPDKKGVSGFHGNAEEGTPKNGQRSSGYTKKDNQFSTASVGCLSNSMESSIREGIITHEHLGRVQAQSRMNVVHPFGVPC
ncbi:hypothetical protein MG293_012874 [Ovis ammon polii]|uniref:Uncharacterized protein n=1 Tax=Ovis ammon polii TaxID=230172 RepID=A0AAD4U1C0_OVIAM|nr:hypothetical protein MG293_012874 [Ovis ammon polii]